MRDFTYLTRPKMTEAQARATVDRLNIVQRCRWFNQDMHAYIKSGRWKNEPLRSVSPRHAAGPTAH